MGNCHCNTNADLSKRDSTSAYTFGIALGQGGFGKVWKVTHKKEKKEYAMKVMQKKKILTKKSVTSILNERKILSQINNLFIINMKLAFQDKENLYLVLEYMNGGDMRYHINRGVEYTEEETKFIACSIIYGLSAIHKANVIHRDLKPENLVFNSDGYLKITDFGIARYYQPDNAHHTSGTPGYMAPEVLLRQPHGFLVDYYALGVILFEIVYGERPYLGKNRKEIKDKIIKEQRKLRKNDMPDDSWTMECADFINKLLQRNPANRLGIKGIEQIISHPWVADFPWEKLANKTYESSFKPVLTQGESGGSFVNTRQNQQEDDKDKENQILLRRNSVQEKFADFDYDPEGILNMEPKKRDKQNKPENIDTPPPMTTHTQMNSSQKCQNSQISSMQSPIKKKQKSILINNNNNNNNNTNNIQNPEEQQQQQQQHLQKIDEKENEGEEKKQQEPTQYNLEKELDNMLKQQQDQSQLNNSNNNNTLQINDPNNNNNRRSRMTQQSKMSQQNPEYAESQMRQNSFEKLI